MNKMDIEKKVLELNSFKEFNKMQKTALKKNWKEKNQVIAAPTSSGKTMLAELCALNSIINKKKKVIYTCPLKALASEHFQDFKKKYSKSLSIRIALSTGDFDSSSKYLSKYDLILCTTEKVDSLIRHGAPWLQNIGLLIVDEVHEIDSCRGPTLEMVISKLRILNPELQVLALSATAPNSKELAEWLNAELTKSNFRPVKLSKGIYLNNEIKFLNSKPEKIANHSDQIFSLVFDTLQKKKQCLISVNSRKRSLSLAKKLASITEKSLTQKGKNSLELLSKKILSSLESPTEQCKEIAECVKKGTSPHNAGILRKQLQLIEDAFRERKLKVLVATPTLTCGINLPSFRVIMPSVYRYTELGMTPLTVREVNQTLGRSGRTGLDTLGQGILIAKNEVDYNDLLMNYLLAEEEDVHSQLGIEPILRTHLLALIASRFVYDFSSLKEFFSKTFYALQFGNLSELMEKLESLVQELEEMLFIEFSEEKFVATRLGKRVSELYLDPLSANKIIQGLEKPLNDLGLLFLLINTSEFSPYFSLPKKKENETFLKMREKKHAIPIDVEREQFFDVRLAQKFNSSLLLLDWISEKPEQLLLKEFAVQPGILHSKLLITDWLSYSAIELSTLLKKEENIPSLIKLRKRLKYGIKAELLELVELKGIGRVRARKLFNAKIHSISDVKKASLLNLSKILGEKTALQIKKQLGQKLALSQKEKTQLKTKPKQSSLNYFSNQK